MSWRTTAVLAIGCLSTAVLAGRPVSGDEANRAKEDKVETIQVGQQVPDFSLPGSDGKTYRLADFKGKQAVVIAWFPKAFTGG